MDSNHNFYIETPQSYNKLCDKKKGELNDALFLLNGNILKDFFSNKRKIRAICDDQPDIRVEFIESDTNKTIGLEMVKCYLDSRGLKNKNYRNRPQINNALKDICEAAFHTLVKDIKMFFLMQKVTRVQAIFHHEIITNGFNGSKQVKNEIAKEFVMQLRKCLMNQIQCPGRYIQKIQISETGYMPANLCDRVEILSDMMSIVLPIDSMQFDPIALKVKQKREKLHGYKKMNKNQDVTEWWLGISIPHDAYLKVRDYKLPLSANLESFENNGTLITENYDRIFLIDRVYDLVIPIYQKEKM